MNLLARVDGFLLTLCECSILLGVAMVPLAVFWKRSRLAIGKYFYWISFLQGLMLWAESVLYTILLAGVGWVIVGLLILGIGVLPIAFVAALCTAHWQALGELAFELFLLLVLRLTGLWMIEAETTRRDNEWIARLPEADREKAAEKFQELLAENQQR